MEDTRIFEAAIQVVPVLMLFWFFERRFRPDRLDLSSLFFQALILIGTTLAFFVSVNALAPEDGTTESLIAALGMAIAFSAIVGWAAGDLYFAFRSRNEGPPTPTINIEDQESSPSPSGAGHQGTDIETSSEPQGGTHGSRDRDESGSSPGDRQ